MIWSEAAKAFRPEHRDIKGLSLCSPAHIPVCGGEGEGSQVYCSPERRYHILCGGGRVCCDRTLVRVQLRHMVMEAQSRGAQFHLESIEQTCNPVTPHWGSGGH